MSEVKISPEIQEVARGIATHVIERSIRPAVNPDQVENAMGFSLQNDSALRTRIVLCPNWQVDERGRTIGEIPVSVDTTNHTLVYEDPSMKIVPFLTEEVPDFVDYLNRNGVKVELLVILADILSPAWVHDAKAAKEKLAQNQKAIKLMLMSSCKGKEIFRDRNKAAVIVQSQLQLAKGTPDYEQVLKGNQMEALQLGTPMSEWYISVIRQMQKMNEYSDIRKDLTGMKKIWDRALFLAAMYALDGQLFKGDFVRAGFKGPIDTHEHIGLGSVATQHGDIIAQGWSLENPLGIITPFNNAMEHSWSEPKVSATKF